MTANLNGSSRRARRVRGLAAGAAALAVVVAVAIAASASSAIPLPRGCALRPHGHCNGARLAGRSLAGRNLTGISLVGANLAGATLTRANLNAANLSRAGLVRARFASAHLVRANLSRANLTHAVLSGADLDGANLSGAQLAGATFVGVRANGVHGVPRSLPAGYHLAAGSILRNAPAIPIRHVVWIVMENRGLTGLIGNRGAPSANALASTYGLATDYAAVAHPSLPNYIALTSGGTQGITDDNAPATHRLSAPSIFSQLGPDWRALEESMPGNCRTTDSGSYTARHNPAAYYTGVAAACAAQDTPLAAPPDLSAKFTLITPNLCHDMHTCSVGAADAWLGAFVPTLLATPEYVSGGTVIFIVWDESDWIRPNRVPLIVIWPWTRRVSSAAAFSHYSLLRTTEDLLGVPALGAARTAPSLAAAFNLP
jgi:phosphatidylinositol-3-phosphatase